jgi:hypothetical protein
VRAARTALSSGELADEPRARLEQLARELEAKLGPAAAALAAPVPLVAPAPLAAPMLERAAAALEETGPTPEPGARAQHFDSAPTNLRGEGGAGDMTTQIYGSARPDPEPPGAQAGPSGTK